MARYAINEQLGGSQQNLGTAYKTIVLFTANSAGTIRRGKLYDLTVGQNGAYASTDTEVEWDVSRQTAAGTATTVTPNALDPADAAFSGLAAANATAEGTVTANSSGLHLSINQRATYRWVAAPGSEIVYPATASNGLAIRAKGETAGYASTASAQALVEEQ